MSKVYYIPIKKRETFELIIRKSRFISNLKYVESKAEALGFLDEIKADYKDARHNCYAFLTGKPASPTSIGYSDDGEPKGTAGPPILNVIQQKNISMICIVVTRYFGGVKLGSGGLIRAYSGAASGVVDKAGISKYEQKVNLSIVTDYTNISSIMSFLTQNNLDILNPDYKENISMDIEVKMESKERIISQIKEITKGSAKVTVLR